MCRLGALPFHPMALGSYAQLAGALSVDAGKAPSIPALERRELTAPLFVSPKHDGIRLLSVKNSRNAEVTCFSRFGRPLQGLFWIEEEMKILRELCADPQLCLDGELYIHRTPAGVAKNGDCKQSRLAAGTVEGFAAVCSLVQKFRSKHHSADVSSSIDKVAELAGGVPNYCVFDIVQYNPANVRVSGEGLDFERSASFASRVEAVRSAVMQQCSVTSLEQLMIHPNHSPFTQRLRTLNFLFHLLSQWQHHHGVSSNAPSSSRHVYKGGQYVHLVPYQILPLITDAHVVLKDYNRAGYEGAVIRTALNRYHAASKASKPHRSFTAAKLLPYFESEYVVLDVVMKSRSPSKNVRTQQQAFFWGLQCATEGGATFKVALPAMLHDDERQQLLKQLQGHRKSATELIGLYVTLQYPSILRSGIPRFPQVKGIRGGKSWFL